MILGMGPRPLLERLNTTVIKDLPGVGQSMWDQPWYGTPFRVDVPTNSAGLNDPSLAAAAFQAYPDNASGPLSVFGTGILGFAKLPPDFRNNLSTTTQIALNDTFPANWPNLEFFPASGFIGNQSNYANLDPVGGYNYITISIALVAPFSRGNISISSSSMTDPPIVNPNHITDPADIELAVAAFIRQR